MFFIPGPVIAALTFPGVIIREHGPVFCKHLIVRALLQRRLLAGVGTEGLRPAGLFLLLAGAVHRNARFSFDHGPVTSLGASPWSGQKGESLGNPEPATGRRAGGAELWPRGMGRSRIRHRRGHPGPNCHFPRARVISEFPAKANTNQIPTSGSLCHEDGSFFRAHDKPASLPRPFILLRAAIAPYCFIMVRICRYCLRTVLTSWTVVPLPLAMRLRRLPSMTLWSRRSWLVMELMMASTRVSWPSSTLASLGRFWSGPIFGSMSTIFSSGPILRICFS